MQSLNIPVTLDPTPLRAAQLHHDVRDVDAVVWHYTAGASSPVSWLHHPECKVSWHFTIQQDGEIWQHAGLDQRCSHAGGRSSRLADLPNVNGRTIGVEVVNPGPVMKIGGAPWSWKDETGNLHPWRGGIVVARGGSFWAAYTAAQVQAIQRLGAALGAVFPQLLAPGAHVGHEDVDPMRKTDPGPAFPWTQLHSALLEVVLAQMGP